MLPSHSSLASACPIVALDCRCCCCCCSSVYRLYSEARGFILTLPHRRSRRRRQSGRRRLRGYKQSRRRDGNNSSMSDCGGPLGGRGMAFLGLHFAPPPPQSRSDAKRTPTPHVRARISLRDSGRLTTRWHQLLLSSVSVTCLE